ncbi:hypothetical protein [Ectobacillus funiculus]|uniref:hypothetical protein n=1 Tax=Ectobacillus funiculus TaxID=137993 RepID=UPI00101C09C9|nr:hypothetical protein [Ectobacillus funiculus]
MEIQVPNNEEYILGVLGKEVQQRGVRKINLLLQQATLLKVTDNLFQLERIRLAQGLTRDYT